MEPSPPPPPLKIRVLAARIRSHAAQTAQDAYRAKFEQVAEDLEDAAARLEPHRYLRDCPTSHQQNGPRT